jgi:hypothetical protein
MQAALHQDFGLAASNELHGFGGRGVTVCGIDDSQACEIDTCGLGDLLNLRLRAHEDGRDQPVLGRFDRTFESGQLARVRHRGDDRIKTSTPL